MAGETIKTANLTNIESSVLSDSKLIRGSLVEAKDYDALSATETEVGDILLTAIDIPSNAIISEILIYNDDLDAHATPTLTLDVGLFASEKFTSVTSSTATIHAENAVLDADLFVDGSTVLQAATTSYTSQALDSGTCGPDDIYKEVWELLSYDSNPKTNFRVGLTFAAGAATGAAGDIAILVRYSVN